MQARDAPRSTWEANTATRKTGRGDGDDSGRGDQDGRVLHSKRRKTTPQAGQQQAEVCLAQAVRDLHGQNLVRLDACFAPGTNGLGDAAIPGESCISAWCVGWLRWGDTLVLLPSVTDPRGSGRAWSRLGLTLSGTIRQTGPTASGILGMSWWVRFFVTPYFSAGPVSFLQPELLGCAKTSKPLRRPFLQ
jgi:hypothetical protein